MKQEYPKVVYVKSGRQLEPKILKSPADMKQLEESKVEFGESPADFGIETHPESPVVEADVVKYDLPAAAPKAKGKE